MEQYVNAIKAPFVDLSTVPEAERPSDRQIAVVWALIGALVVRAL